MILSPQISARFVRFSLLRSEALCSSRFLHLLSLAGPQSLVQPIFILLCALASELWGSSGAAHHVLPTILPSDHLPSGQLRAPRPPRPMKRLPEEKEPLEGRAWGHGGGRLFSRGWVIARAPTPKARKQKGLRAAQGGGGGRGISAGSLVTPHHRCG